MYDLFSEQHWIDGAENNRLVSHKSKNGLLNPVLEQTSEG